MWPWASGPTGSWSPYFLRTLTSCPHHCPIPHSQITRTSEGRVFGSCALFPSPPGGGKGYRHPPKPRWGYCSPICCYLSASLGVPHLCASERLSALHLVFQNRKCRGPKGVSQVIAEEEAAETGLPPTSYPWMKVGVGTRGGSSLMSLLILPLWILMRGRDLIRGQGALTSVPWSHPIPPPVPEPSAGPGETGAGGLGNRTGAGDLDSWVLAEEMTCAPGLTEQGAEDPDS